MDLYEAATLDGPAGGTSSASSPGRACKNTRTFILVTITIAALSLFAQIHVMTSGGPLDSTSTVVFQAVRAGYSSRRPATPRRSRWCSSCWC